VKRSEQDVSVRKRAEERLQQNEGLMRTITDSAQDAILMMDSEGGISYWNPAAERILGYTSDEALGQNLHDLIVPARFLPAHHAAYPAFLQTGQGAAVGKTLDLAARRKDGLEISIQLSLSAIQMNGGWHAVGIIRDTTESKRSEESLRLQSAALEAAANAIVITDHSGIIQWVNHAFTTLTGYTAQEVVGQNPRILKGGNENEAFYRNLWQTISSGQVWSGELTNRRQDGSLYAEEMTITPLRNADGVIARYIAIKQDITERKRAENLMRQSDERYRSLFDNAKDAIFAG
jgi:PAS domain S-box-containing protein